MTQNLKKVTIREAGSTSNCSASSVPHKEASQFIGITNQMYFYMDYNTGLKRVNLLRKPKAS